MAKSFCHAQRCSSTVACAKASRHTRQIPARSSTGEALTIDILRLVSFHFNNSDQNYEANMLGYSSADLERDILLLDQARAAIAGMVVRYGQATMLERALDAVYKAGCLSLAQAHVGYIVMERLVSERMCTGHQAQPVYDMIDALEKGYVCGECGILQGRGVEKAHRRMGHLVITGCRLRFKAGMLAAMNGNKDENTIHAHGDAPEILRKEMRRLEAQTLAGISEARAALEPQAPMPKESQRWKKEQEIEDPEWRHNLDATKGIGYPAREEGHYGSHPAHDGFDDESKP
jgi:hypothetical protein